MYLNYYVTNRARIKHAMLFKGSTCWLVGIRDCRIVVRVIMMPFALLAVPVSLRGTVSDRHRILVVIRAGCVDKSLKCRYSLVD